MQLISNLRNAAATSGGTGTGASNGTAFLIDATVPDSISDERVSVIFHQIGVLLFYS